MQSTFRAGIVLALAIGLATSAEAAASPPYQTLVARINDEFSHLLQGDDILDAARNLFWTLASISLVWTMGLQIVRQDIGEALMELLRFMIMTGTLYWLLINASEQGGGEGFVKDIVGSFHNMASTDVSDDAFKQRGNAAAWRALDVFLKIMDQTGAGEDPDRIVGGLMGVLILLALTLLAAQFLLALIMAWFLGYGGIFLLGFGGSRWTSQIAINYYKHVVAIGIAILALGVIGIASDMVFRELVPTFGQRSKLTYFDLGMTLAVAVLMLVLGLRVPQLLYTLVTGSSLGMLAGTAGMVGSAIATGGGAAFASASVRFSPGSGPGDMPGSGGSTARSPSAMEAVERSAVSAGSMTDPFHVAGGSDPFGVARGTDARRTSGGSVFGTPAAVDNRSAIHSAIAAVHGGALHRDEYEDTQGPVGRSTPAMLDVPDSRSTSMAAASPSADEALRNEPARPDYAAEMSAITTARGSDADTAWKARREPADGGGLTDGSLDPRSRGMDSHASPEASAREGLSIGDVSGDTRSLRSAASRRQSSAVIAVPEGQNDAVLEHYSSTPIQNGHRASEIGTAGAVESLGPPVSESVRITETVDAVENPTGSMDQLDVAYRHQDVSEAAASTPAPAPAPAPTPNSTSTRLAAQLPADQEASPPPHPGDDKDAP